MLLVGLSVLIFDFSYYLMSSLPGSRNSMCVVGANLTALNIGFSLIMSVLAGLMVVAMINLAGRRYTAKKAVFGSLSGFGFFAGLLSVFCPVCSLPVLGLLGLSLGMEFFTEHHLIIKVFSLVAVIGGLYLLNSQLKEKCTICK